MRNGLRFVASGIGCVGVFVVLGMGAFWGLGVPFPEMTSREIGICIALFLVAGVFAWLAVILRFERLDSRIVEVAAALRLRTKGLRIFGEIGGVPVEATEVLLETAEKKRLPCWAVTATSRAPQPLAVITVGGVGTAQALELRSVDVADTWGARYALGIESRMPDWVGPDVRARLDGIATLVQVRCAGPELRVLVRRPLTDFGELYRSFLLARSLVAPPLDDETLRASPGFAVGEERERPPRSSKLRVVLMALVAVPIAAFMVISPDAEGYEQEALRYVRSCRLAQEALGTPIERVHLGVQLGSRTNNDQESELIVRGPRAQLHVTIHVYARRRGTPADEMPLRRVMLESSWHGIEAITCTEGAPMGLPGGARRGAGAVVSVRGGAPVPVGTACTFEVTPTRRIFPCRAVVRCGALTLFGAAPTHGFAMCAETSQPNGTHAIVVRDDDHRLPRTEPSLLLDERLGRADLMSPGRDWSLSIALTPR